MIKRYGEAVMSFLLGGVTLAISHMFLASAAVDAPNVVLAAIAFLLLVINTFLILLLLKNTQELRAIAPRIHYYDIFGVHGKGVLYEEARNIIKQAEREILILNWSAEEDSDDMRESRDSYFEDLEKSSARVHYIRVIQSPTYDQRQTNMPTIADQFDGAYVAHFKAMLAAKDLQRESGQHEAELFVVPLSVPTTFLIADDHHLVWQLNEVKSLDADGNPHWQIRGAIVVHDPGGEFVSAFRATFDRVRGRHIRVLEQADLEKHLRPSNLQA